MYEPKLEFHFEDLAGQRHAARLGLWIFLASELLLFAALFTLYFGYRSQHLAIFHEAVGHNARGLGTINTAVLLLGSTAAAIGVNQLRRGRRRPASLLFAGAALAAAIFLCIKGYEYFEHFREGIRPGGMGAFFDEHPGGGWPIFFTLYFGMTGLHGIHVAVGGGILAWTAWWISKRRVGSSGAYRAEFAALYWHLVDVIWVFLWPMFYLMGSHR